MASKKYLELQDFSDEDLKAELTATQAEYQKLQFDHSLKGLDNPVMLREMRRDIARLNTEVRRRELSNMSEDDVNKRSKIRSRRRRK